MSSAGKAAKDFEKKKKRLGVSTCHFFIDVIATPSDIIEIKSFYSPIKDIVLLLLIK